MQQEEQPAETESPGNCPSHLTPAAEAQTCSVARQDLPPTKYRLFYHRLLHTASPVHSLLTVTSVRTIAYTSYKCGYSSSRTILPSDSSPSTFALFSSLIEEHLSSVLGGDWPGH